MRAERRAPAHIAAFLLPAALLLAVYAAMGMWPFGDRTILASDMADQYVEFFCALKNGDVYFSWSKALGSSYIGVFSYYVSSPLSFLTLLAPNEYMPAALMLLCCLKSGLIGLAFSFFYRRRFGRAGTACLLFSLCYALSSYVAAYSLCIMWLDGLIWLPLILLALDRAIERRGAGYLTFALTVCFLSTWYISYMIGGFCLLWLLCAAARGDIPLRAGKAAPKLGLARALGALIGSALIALLLTSPVWLPSFLAMFSGKLSDATADYPALTNFGAEFLRQFLPGQYSSITSSALPYFFSGTVVTLLAAAYFFLRGVPARRRIASGALIALLILSMWLSPLDRVWHLFKYPNWFPYRYAFLLSFALVFTAAEASRIIFPKLPRLAAPALLALTAAELALNCLVILRGVDSQFRYESFSDYYAYYTANAALVDEAESASGGGFYRVGATEDRGFNSPLSFGYPGITHYSSVYDKDVNAALKSLGFAQSWMWTAYYGSTPATDALFGVRYVISGDAQPLYAPIESSGGLALWQNENALPLAFLANDAPESLASSSPLERQNELLRALSGLEADVFTPIAPDSVERGSAGATLTFTGTGRPIYADLSSYGLDSLFVNGSFVSYLNTDETRSVHLLSCPAVGETVTVTVNGSAASGLGWEAMCCELDPSALGAVSSALDNITSLAVDGASVELQYEADASGVLASTIPAEPGWRAYIDGESAEPREWLGAFLALDVPAGSHTVTLRYTAPGLPLSCGLAAAALLLMFLRGARRKLGHL